MYIVVIILVIIAIPLIFASFLSEDYFIERDIVVNRPKQEVFDYVKYLKNAGAYNKWVMTDPHLRKTFSGTDGTPGFVYGWDSDNKNVGKGEQEIKSIREGQRIDYELRFVKPFVGVSYAHIVTEPTADNKTNVKWVFNGKRNYPMRIFHLLFNLKKVLGNDLQTSLGNLKTVLEK
jgi:hypothetical protein